jgi:hypothetical protein
MHTNITGRYNRNFKRVREKACALCGKNTFWLVRSAERDRKPIWHKTHQPLRCLEKSLRRKLRRDQNTEQPFATRVIRKQLDKCMDRCIGLMSPLPFLAVPHQIITLRTLAVPPRSARATSPTRAIGTVAHVPQHLSTADIGSTFLIEITRRRMASHLGEQQAKRPPRSSIRGIEEKFERWRLHIDIARSISRATPRVILRTTERIATFC